MMDKITKNTLFNTADDPTRFFEYSSKTHCFLDDDLGKVVCGRKLGVQWLSNQQHGNLKNIDEAIERTSCKNCLKKLKKARLELNQ